jgi:hypothetical protein
MNYLIARTNYLKNLGYPMGEERLKAIKAFDRTPVAWAAKFTDSCAAVYWKVLNSWTR